MNVLLCVLSCGSCSPTLIRHWPYFLNQEADHNAIITTVDKDCATPPGVETIIAIGGDSYINGDHLPTRMIDVMEQMLEREWDILIMAEYDCLFFHRIPVEKMSGDVAGHLAGGTTWGSKARHFYHNPHVFNRAIVPVFIKRGRRAIKDGVCGHMTSDAYGLPESSPDVFFGYVTQELGLIVQVNLWQQFSRNSLDIVEDLKAAREAYRGGVNIIHGVKTQKELEYITT